jgi:3-phosphoshikimate 1-carboxyvinyltransferase
MTPLRKRRTRPLTGSIAVPGDKSISHRAVMLAALASGASTITGANRGEDVGRTISAVGSLGASVAAPDRSSIVKVEGWGPAGPSEPYGVVDAGNSGTTARILLGLMAGLEGHAVLSGDASLSRRPMLRIVAPLRAMGATIDGRGHGDRLPLSIRGGPLEGLDHHLEIASAQVKSALLLAGLHASGTTSVTEPVRSRDHTENMLRAAGVTVDVGPTTVGVEGGQRPVAMQWDVPGDISSAMYLIAGAAMVEGSDLIVEGAGLNPTRTGALSVLDRMGADLSVTPSHTASGEPAGDIHIRASHLRGCVVDETSIPSLIDEIPILAIAASQAEGETVFEGVGELRTKESDRLGAIAGGLRALGGDAEVSGDRLIIRGPSVLRGGNIDSLGDHRMAMSFAIAGLISDSTIKVQNWSCVQTSFPTFLEVLGRAQGAVK